MGINHSHSQRIPNCERPTGIFDADVWVTPLCHRSLVDRTPSKFKIRLARGDRVKSQHLPAEGLIC
ncbi:hypothetical protein QUB30_19205 [Microcoleus sp. BROC3]